jgi:hypothetical protein
LRIDHAEINNRIDRHRHVVTRHHLLPLDVDGHDAQIHSNHAVDDRDQKDQSWSFRAQQLSESKNDAAFVFSQDPNRLRKNNYGENDDGHGPTDQLRKRFD